MSRAVALAFIAMVLGACSEPLEFRDWTTEVPEGTRIIEYGPVSLEEREGKIIEVVEDLTIGDEGDLDYRFYRALGMGASDDGLIYVFDAGNYRIQVYDAEGRYLQTIGRRGGGPGEISQPSGHFVVAGDQLVLGGGFGNLAIWDRRTGVVRFRGQAASGARILWRLGSTEAGGIVAVHQALDPASGNLVRAIAWVTPDDYELISMLPTSSSGP